MIRIFIVVIGLIAFHHSVEEARDIRITDAIEYSFAARNLTSTGHYEFKVGEQMLPPRYAPWFSAFFLAPSYLILGPDIGNGIYAITLSSILLLLLGFTVASAQAGMLGGLATSGLLLLNPTLRYLGTEMMADVPLAMSIVLALLCFQKIRAGKTDTRWFLYAGLAVALAFACKPSGIFIILPIAYAWYCSRRSFFDLLVSVLPPMVLIVATCWYNSAVFGDPLRTGYHFWLSVPHDVPGLTFSANYIAQNLLKIFESPIFAGLVVFALIGQWFKRSRHLLEFVLLFSVPYLIFHSFYYYFSPRFLLPVEVVLCILIGSSMVSHKRSLVMAAYLAVIALAFAQPFKAANPRLGQTFAAIQSQTPADAIILTDAPVAYFEGLETGSRRYIPLSRKSEYASKLIMPIAPRDLEPVPTDPFAHRDRVLLSAGAQEVVLKTVEEIRDELAPLVQSGKVFKAFGGNVERVTQ